MAGTSSILRPVAGTRIRRLLIAATTIGFLSLIIALGAAAWVNGQSRDHSLWVEHTYRVQQALSDYRILIEQNEAARRGYLLSGRAANRDRYQLTEAQLPAALAALHDLVGDNASQRRRVGKIEALTARLIRDHRATNALIAAGRGAEAHTAYLQDDSPIIIAEIRQLVDAMDTEETGLLSQRDAVQKASFETFLIVISIAGGLLVLVAVITTITLLRYTHDLNATSARLQQLNESLEDAVDERTADLTRANEEIQRFAYIVSHDLRSPLVNVMGFTAELDAATGAIRELIDRAEEAAPDIVTEEARYAAREDLPEAIGFIRTSTQKMDALINAILKLSREGRRVISPERIDMDALVGRIGETLQHRLDERDAELIVRHPLPAIVTDRLAIDQIFSNIIENAVKYLQPGRPGRIEVRGRTEGLRAIFEIEDNGRGIDPRDHARVFDLFRRSGPQDQPGEGIGLAHVRALVYRLGGLIDVSSELGKGATFRLSLPQTFMPAQESRK
jgi:signal transduction histidine kinase